MSEGESASYVVPVALFYADSEAAWQQAYKTAAHGMAEPLQVKTDLSFCRFVDLYGQPMDWCDQTIGRYAVCTVTCKDLGVVTTEEPEWEPLCVQSAPALSNRNRTVVS